MSTSDKSKKNDSVTVADLIMLLAFGFFAVLFYIGFSINGKSAGEATLCTLLAIVGLYIILSALKRVKQVKNDFSKWKVVEALLFIIFLGVFIWTSKPVAKTLSVTFNKTDLINKGKEDIENVKSLFDLYQKNEGDAIEKMEQSFNQINSNKKQRKDSKVKEYLDKTVTGGDYTRYCNTLKREFLMSKYLEYKIEQKALLKKDSTILDNWSLIKIAGVIKNFESNYSKISDTLTAFSKQRHPDHSDVPYKYVIKNNKGIYIIDEEGTRNLEYEYLSPDLSFSDAVKNAKSPFAVIIKVLICIMMLIGYITAPRSTTVDIIKSSKKTDFDDGGISL